MIIKVADDVKITVTQIQGDGNHAQVRIGVSAPRGLAVHRREIHAEIQDNVSDKARKEYP